MVKEIIEYICVGMSLMGISYMVMIILLALVPN